MKIKILISTLVVLLIINVAALGSFLFLHYHSHHQPPQLDRVHRWVVRNVPEKDRDKFFRTAHLVHDDIGPKVEETRGLEKQLIESMRQDPVPRAHIDSLLEQISRNRLEIARTATDRMIAMGDSLSADERGRMADALLRFRNVGGGEHWKK